MSDPDASEFVNLGVFAADLEVDAEAARRELAMGIWGNRVHRPVPGLGRVPDE